MFCDPAGYVPHVPGQFHTSEPDGRGTLTVTFNLPQNKIQGDIWHVDIRNVNTRHWRRRTVPVTTRVVVYEDVQPDKHQVYFQGGQSTTGETFFVSVHYDFHFRSGKCSSYLSECVRVCVCVCQNEKRECQTNGKHHRRKSQAQ